MADAELNEILLKEEEPVSDSATHCNTLSLGQQVKQPQRRDDMKVLLCFNSACDLVMLII